MTDLEKKTQSSWSAWHVQLKGMMQHSNSKI